MEVLLSHVKVCVRGGSFKLLCYLGITSIILAIMVSVFAGRQQQTLLVDFAFSTIRVSMCFAALLWVQEVFSKTIDTKTIVQYLAFPSSRQKHIYLVFVAIALLLLFTVVVFAVLVAVAANIINWSQISTPVNFGAAYWCMWGFMYIDILVVTGFCILIASISTTPYLAVVVSFGFYLAGHSMQNMIDLLSIAQYIDGREFFQSTLSVIRFLAPDLSSFDVRYWALYSESIVVKEVFLKSVSGIAYLLVSLSLADFCFRRREIV